MSTALPGPAIDPQTSASIRAAQDAIEQEVKRAALTNDPLRHHLTLVSNAIGAMHKLIVDGSLTLTKQIETAAQHIDEAKQPVRDDELRRAVITGISSHANAAIRAANWRTLAIGTAAVIAFGMVCAGSAWFVTRSHLTAAVAGIEHRLTGAEADRWLTIMQNNDIVATEKAGTCAAQNGRAACVIAVWVEPPPPPTMAPEKR